MIARVLLGKKNGICDVQTKFIEQCLIAFADKIMLNLKYHEISLQN